VWAYAEDAQDLDDTYTETDRELLEDFLNKTAEARPLSPTAPALWALVLQSY